MHSRMGGYVWKGYVYVCMCECRSASAELFALVDV